MVEYVDSSKTIVGEDNFENEYLRLLELSPFTIKNWTSLLSTNAECSNEVYNILDEGDRKFDFIGIPESKFAE